MLFSVSVAMCAAHLQGLDVTLCYSILASTHKSIQVVHVLFVRVVEGQTDTVQFHTAFSMAVRVTPFVLVGFDKCCVRLSPQFNP